MLRLVCRLGQCAVLSAGAGSTKHEETACRFARWHHVYKGFTPSQINIQVYRLE
jgi:hypothetical protein